MDDDHTSTALDMAAFDGTRSFCRGYPLRRHRFESLANRGCHEARQDWMRYIGPIDQDQFGGCNPRNGNFTALVLPLVRAERLKTVAYVLEYAFLHDNVVETVVSCPGAADGDAFRLGDDELGKKNAGVGRKQMQAKMMVQLMRIDAICAKRVLDVWKTMLLTTLKHKSDSFESLDEYLDYRITDTGAPFVESVMLWGMGMTLTKEENMAVADVIRPCFASLALANDYFSFDREWEEAQNGGPKPTNAVWLHMQWHGVDVSTAKRMVRGACNRFEAEFVERSKAFQQTNPLGSSEKTQRYLRGLTYQVSGNVVWSLNCPRYHPEFRYDANVGVEDVLSATLRDSVHENAEPESNHHRASMISLESQPTAGSSSDAASESGWSTSSSRSSSFSEHSSSESSPPLEILQLPHEDRLNDKLLTAPLNYLTTLPSKGVRSTLIDALNTWCSLPPSTLTPLKSLISTLHSASLLLDDIQDSSPLRRGHPAAHILFGTAQTINTATATLTTAIETSLSLPIPDAPSIVLSHLRDLHIGQSYDLHWTRHAICPSVDEYVEMVTKKTGGLFLMLSALMTAHLSEDIRTAVQELVTKLSVYFQIRDDFQNLNSADYHDEKGFCEDLDEGKMSFVVVHHLNAVAEGKGEEKGVSLREIWREREGGGLSVEQKKVALGLLEGTGSLGYTCGVLKGLEAEVETGIGKVEGMTGKENWVLRLCLERLKV
ncbi:isoprenoid synthase domain-containing protein [Podospora aff. communis PSN243]|uniref:Isoprenoid synthase domain-containing protein n=1 Tax=Podospora aff. communis PSN243 TaxID=3040156 RepID=A0AAV9GT08_9PEZI|nr:isoprenoid synthase domain-containing protein [Podospora aff. communis PSN243]